MMVDTTIKEAFHSIAKTLHDEGFVDELQKLQYIYDTIESLEIELQCKDLNSK